MRILKCFFFLFFLLKISYSQNCNADPAISYMLPETDDVHFLFDTFSEYAGGSYQYGKTILKLNVVDNPLLTCQWRLYMVVSNNGWVNTDQWNALATYGTGVGDYPSIDMLELRITNNCNTPLLSKGGVPIVLDNGWAHFDIPPGTSDAIDIINDINPYAAGNCNGDPVNLAGTYLGTNYNEYSFTIDYRIRPGYTLKPGYYNLSVAFFLAE